jgi:hypothetical protein
MGDYEVFMEQLDHKLSNHNKMILDKDWVDLIMQALEVGLTLEDIRDFIQPNSNKLNELSM